MNSAKVRCVASVPSASLADCADVLVCSSNVNMVVGVSSIFSPLAITGTGSSFYSGVFSVSSVSSWNRESADWCLTPARCFKSK